MEMIAEPFLSESGATNNADGGMLREIVDHRIAWTKWLQIIQQGQWRQVEN